MKATIDLDKMKLVSVLAPPTWEEHLVSTTWEYLLDEMKVYKIHPEEMLIIPRTGESIDVINVLWSTTHMYQAVRPSDTRSWLGWEILLDEPATSGVVTGEVVGTTLFGWDSTLRGSRV